MAEDELRMTPVQMAALVDAAFRTRHPLTCFDTTMETFRMIRRRSDAAATALMGYLYADSEVEPLMRLRAIWKRGHVRAPETVFRPEMHRRL